MKNSIFRLLSLIYIGLFLSVSGCLQPDGTQNTLINPAIPSGSGSGGDSPDAGGGASPVAEIPVFESSINGGGTIAMAGDAGMNVPSLVSVDNGSGHHLLVTSDTDSVAVLKMSREEPSVMTAMMNRIFPTARATVLEVTDTLAEGGATRADNTCADVEAEFPHVKCIDLDDYDWNSSDRQQIEAFYPSEDYTDSSNPKMHYALMNKRTRAITSGHDEEINGNVLYTRKVPTGNTISANGSLYSVGEGSVVKIDRDDNGRFAVQGQANENYEEFSVTGNRIGFDSEAGVFGALDEDNGVEIIEMDVSTGQVLSRVLSRRPENIARFTSLKRAGNALRYGVENTDNVTNGKLYYALENTNFDSDISAPQEIKFVDSDDDFDSSGDQMTHKQTITFDIDNNGFALVVYQDANDLTRLRIAKQGSTRSFDRFGGEVALEGSSGFVDVQIYKQNTSMNDYGKALLLDQMNNKAWIVEYNTRLGPGAIREINIVNSVDLGNAKNPQAFVLSQDKSKAFIVNKGDESISVISLKDSEGSTIEKPEVLTNIKLASQIKNKAFEFKPESIQIKNDNLIIGARDLKAQVLINTEEVLSKF